MAAQSRSIAVRARTQRRILVAVAAAIGVAALVVFALAAFSGGASGVHSSAVGELGAQMAVSAQNYQTHSQDGDVVRADADRETLLGDCDTARALQLGADQQSTAIRAFCASLGSPVP